MELLQSVFWLRDLRKNCVFWGLWLLS